MQDPQSHFPFSFEPLANRLNVGNVSLFSRHYLGRSSFEHLHLNWLNCFDSLALVEDSFVILCSMISNDLHNF